jgi:hypothetical protein
MPGLQLALPLQLNDLYSEDDEIFRVGSWALPATPGDDTEGSSGEDAPPLCAVFGWAEEEEAPAASSESSEEDGSEGAAPRRADGAGASRFRQDGRTPPHAARARARAAPPRRPAARSPRAVALASARSLPRAAARARRAGGVQAPELCARHSRQDDELRRPGARA